MTPDIIIGDITGGHTAVQRDIGDNITIQHIWDAFRLYPAFGDIHNLKVKAIWSNGLTDDIVTPSSILELKDAHLWAYLYGYSIIIVDDRGEETKLEAWHPMVDGVGFQFIKVTDRGYPSRVRIIMKAQEVSKEDLMFEVDMYPCELDSNGEPIRTKPTPGEYGFFALRTRGAIKGLQGLPYCLDLLDPIRAQYDILKAYIPYAEKQGMAFPTIGLQYNTSDNRNSIKTQFASQPTTNRILIIGKEDWIEWVSPQADAYDPFPILDWVNQMISRKSQMNKLMLEGDPSGYLSASETAISNWEADVKEDQVFWHIAFKPIWDLCGASEDCTFQDPAKPTFISLMEGLKAIREGMEGIVAIEDIVRLMNEYLSKHGTEEELQPAPEEERIGFQEDQTGSQDSGESGSSSPKNA